MDEALDAHAMTAEQDSRLSETFDREQGRLRNFIRRRVPDEAEAEDILQDVFYELVEAYRMMKPIEQVSAWLFRVARNRIIDFFRKKKPETRGVQGATDVEGNEIPSWEDLLPSPEAGPDAVFARTVLLEQVAAALDELPEEQREIFVANEFDGRTFQEISDATGVSLNTLLSRKRYAVLFLRRRLQSIYREYLKL
jgi:RNA polymerase sigma factor (sigma-70 family)